MKRVKVMFSAGILLVILAALVVFPSNEVRAATWLTCGTWHAVTSPNAGNGDDLTAVAAVSGSDVWSVGSYDSGYRETLVEHWNGKTWQIVSSPNGQTIENDLSGVAAVSANDVWAVGGYRKDFASASTLTEHWDGTRWSIISSPNTSSQVNFLNAVAVVATNDVWAVGSHVDLKRNGNAVYHTLVEHWDGSQWSIVSSADPGNGGNALSGVTAIASNNAWAVGSHATKSGAQPIVEHWDGSSWQVVSSPKAGTYTSLSSISALSANDIWAVGNQANSTSNRSLTEHWDGAKWSIVSSPNSQQPDNPLYAVAVIAANNVWAAGLSGSNQTPGKTLIEHWNGTKWSIVPSANPGQYANSLFGIAGVPQSQQIWAVGIYQTTQSDIGHTLAETNC